MLKNQFSYYIELFDPKDFTTDDETFENDYKVVSHRNSGVQLQIPIFEYNLLARKNWFKLTTKQSKMIDRIDFCFTNLPKIQTKSIINNRILLDVNHFISDKLFYYEKFKYEEFCPSYISMTEIINSDKNNDFFNNPLILKSGNGYSSEGIKIFKNYSENDVIDHINKWKEFKNWTLSEIYISKLWNGFIATNRIYYLVTRLRIKNKIIVNGYWYDEFITYKAKEKFKGMYDCENTKNFFESFITNFDDTSNPIDFFYKRTLKHADYIQMFTYDEYEIIKQKITKYLNIITNEIFSHITCANDYEENYNDENNKNVTFHLYGIDSIITDKLDIKIIEINGAPTLRDFDEEFFNYKRMLDEILKLTTDILYKPNDNINYKYDCKYGKFKESDNKSKFCDMKFIKCGEYVKNLKNPVYFAKTIYDTYPFVINGFFNKNRINKFQRIKNPHSDKIHLFYGQRDLYIRDLSSNNYYDELLEWNKSKCGKNAKILNKIQGITFYLASKDRLHNQMYDFDFVPKSMIYDINNSTLNLELFIKNMKNEYPDEYFIIKPVYGSQGKGISIINSVNIDVFINKMKKSEKSYGYNRFIISKYIKNSKLYNGKKFNLRFYVLICINKLPTFADNKSNVNYYILKDSQIYFSTLPYNIQMESITDEINKFLINNNNRNNNNDTASDFSLPDIQKMIHMTNLQIVKDLSEKLETEIPLNNFVSTLNNLGYIDSDILNIRQQACNIIDKTINLVKNDIRPLNRFVKNSSAFNLIAYDVMLDDNDKLYLIEINRGPDLHGLKITLGVEKITNVFSEIFDITIDNKTTELKYFDKYEVVL
jgi:hypothetical protein